MKANHHTTATTQGPPRTRTVVLIGGMGVGKSRIGAILAARFGLPLVDLDLAIADAEGRTIPELFAERGEPGFRAAESVALAHALAAGPIVLACGGGAVLAQENRRRLADADADVLWLLADFERCAARIDGDPGRPLGGDAARLNVLAQQRRAAYAEVAHACIDAGVAGGRAPDAIATSCAEVLDAIADARQSGHGSASRTTTHEVDGQTTTLVAGEGAWLRSAPTIAAMADAGVDLVSDPRVLALHGESVAATLRAMGCTVRTHLIPGDEAHKDAPTWLALLDSILAGGADRRRLVVALGGGVVCDMAGFAAATAMRGLRHVLLATTVLAQVDAALGGKTGIDTAHGKNLIGAFHQPEMTVCEPLWLRTLDLREVRAGVAEAVKTALVLDADAYAAFAPLAAALRQGDLRALGPVAAAAAAAKLRTVAADPREKGVRICLNFGHTLGHAIERQAGYGAVLHGEAVAIGMVLALRIGVALGVTAPALAAEVEALLQRLGLPTMIPSALTVDELVEALRHDKKAEGQGVRFVLLERPGAFVVRWLQPTEVRAALNGGA